MWPDVTSNFSPNFLPQAIERPTLIVLVGCWLWLFPSALLVVPFILEAGLPWLTIPLGILIDIVIAYGLFIVTRNYLRMRKARREGIKKNPT